MTVLKVLLVPSVKHNSVTYAKHRQQWMHAVGKKSVTKTLITASLYAFVIQASALLVIRLYKCLDFHSK